MLDDSGGGGWVPGASLVASSVVTTPEGVADRCRSSLCTLSTTVGWTIVSAGLLVLELSLKCHIREIIF